MADLAIDPTDIRTSTTPGETAKPVLSRKTLLIASGVTLGMAAIGGAAALVSSINLPSNLSGLAFLPTPEAPRRSEIRIGRLPDMPEIRDGVPAVVGTRPVRVVGHPGTGEPANLGPKPVAAAIVPAATLPPASLPTTFTGPGAPLLVSAVADTPAAPPALVPPPELRPAAPAPVARVAPPAAPEPASTASVSEAVPLPPPAPVRTLAARPPEAKPEKPVRPAQLAARPAPSPAAAPAPAPAGSVAPPAPPPEDRVEILGVKLPNGSDLKNAVSSIGEVLNLPKAF
jgi:hypothetical protein